MTISERIKNLGKMFKGMEVNQVDNENVIYVIVQFPPKWFVDEKVEELFSVKSLEGNEYQGQFYFFADMETGFDKIFDAIEYNIEKMKDAQERATLLQEKAKELRELFQNEEISTKRLKEMKFILPEIDSFDEIGDIINKKQFDSEPVDFTLPQTQNKDKKKGK